MAGLIVVSAGTADLAVADEAEIVAKLMLCDVRRINDVGVAGIHRLFAHKDVLQAARAIVVVAGMDGALPSVVGWLGGGAGDRGPYKSWLWDRDWHGFAAMLTMLNSCSPGVSVVNIDAGFSAGYQGALICRACK